MLQYLFLFHFFYFVFVRNKIDFLLLFAASTWLYHWQIIYGEINLGSSIVFGVNAASEVILAIIMLIVLLGTLIHDRIAIKYHNIPYRKFMDKDNRNVAIVLLVISYTFTVAALILGGGFASLMQGKGEFTQAHGIRYNFFLFIPACYSLIYGIVAKDRRVVYYSLFPVGVYIFSGYRASVVVTFLAVLIMVNFGKKIVTFKILKPLLLCVAAIVFFSVYKNIYIAAKQGDFSGLFDYLDINYLVWAFLHVEWGQISSNLVLTSSQDLSQYYSFGDAFLGSITLVNRLLGIDTEMIRFSHVIREYANPGFSYGLGGTIWGEMYQAGGYMAVGLFAAVVVWLIAYLNIMLLAKKEYVVFFVYYLAFLSFYIHRNDFTLVVGNLKNTIYLLVLSYGVLLLLKKRIRINSNTILFFNKTFKCDDVINPK